jgi:uncharacterized repeat protein (TIGR01451 family)
MAVIVRHACWYVLLAAASSALAQQQGDAPRGGLELKTVVEKVVEVKEADGTTRTELMPVAAAVPGDEVVYTVSFTNVSGTAADNVRITNPIPAEMRYVADTAFGPGSRVLYSVDGGATYGFPQELSVAAADGTRRAAQAADYTHIRWILQSPLEAGAQGFARFRAVLR